MEYFLTSEFWCNMLWVGLIVACVLIFISGFFFCNKLSEVGGGGLFIALSVVAFLFISVISLLDEIKFPCLWDHYRGPVIILAKEAPLLHNYFMAVNRYLARTEGEIKKLNAERENSAMTEAKDVYDDQIKNQENRKKELENMGYRVEQLAQRLYFSKYLTRLGNLSADSDIEQELREVQEACAQLVNEE